MAADNLLGAAVRIRRGWHGGRTGKVVVDNRHSGITAPYGVIKVQLDGSGQVVNINTVEDLEKLAERCTTPSARWWVRGGIRFY